MRVRTEGELLSLLKKNTRTGEVTEGSPTGTLETIERGAARTLSRISQDLSTAIDQARLKTAQGIFLEEKAEERGVFRKAAARAGSETGQIVYTERTTFGSLSGGAAIGIEAGTLISSRDGNYVVRVKGEAGDVYALDLSQSTQAIPVESISTSLQERIPVGVLTDWAPPIPGIQTRNQESFTSRTRETDTNLRYRTYLAARASQGSSLAALEGNLLSLSGVSQVILRPFSRGVGSIDILVVGTGGRPNALLLEEVRQRASRYYETVLFTVRPVETRTLALRVAGNRELEAVANTVFSQYLDDLDPGSGFNYSDWVSRFERRTRERVRFVNIIVDGEERETSFVSPGVDRIFVPDERGGAAVQIR